VRKQPARTRVKIPQDGVTSFTLRNRCGRGANRFRGAGDQLKRTIRTSSTSTRLKERDIPQQFSSSGSRGRRARDRDLKVPREGDTQLNSDVVIGRGDAHADKTQATEPAEQGRLKRAWQNPN
jgi:hypothetical protein